MEAMTLDELLNAVEGKLLGSFDDLTARVDRVDTDSRSIHPGSLFIPLVGERFDGHAYIAAALDAGAAGCLTARERESYLPGKFYIKVTNTQKALRDLAAYVRRKFPIPLIGVTGSVGKTTTKDMLAAVLGVKYRVLKTEGNFNNRVGLPLTLLRLDHTHEICVLELGMSQPGEIEYLSAIARPDVAVITNIGDAHIENLGSRENILKAKCEIFTGLNPGGLALLNGDDPLLAPLADTLPFSCALYGHGEGCRYRAEGETAAPGGHLLCRLITPAMDREVDIPGLGSHMVYPALVAAAVGERYGLTPEEIAQGILQFEPTKMRMNVLRRSNGITILDDTYNANPQSMRAAIEVLGSSRSRWKTAILGDMFELGSLAPALHIGVGEYLGPAGVDCVVTVGPLAGYIAQAARESGVPAVYPCEDKEQAKALLPQLVKPDSTILCKASRGMRLEELVAGLMELTQAE